MPEIKKNNSNPDSIFLPCEAWKSKMSKGEDVSGVGMFKTFVPDEIKVFDGEDGLPRARFDISTEVRDRDADTLASKGWVLDNYKKNPVVLFAHDSRSLPIGQSIEVGASKGKLSSVARFDTDISEYPLPRTVVALLKRGTLRAASVGFVPMEWKDADPETVQDYQKQSMPLDFTKQELVEWSIVPVPSNPEALMQARAAGIDIAPVVNWAGQVLDMYGGAAKQGLWVPRSVLEKVATMGSPTIFKAPNGGWGLEAKELGKEVIVKGVSPSSVSSEKADENTPWSAPSLKDFTDKSWGDLTASEKSNIGRHYAWAAEMPPATFGDLKLPHHQASNGYVVWNGVRAAMGALLGARGGVSIPSADKSAVHAHLSGHYKQFGKEPPALKDYTEEELKPLFSDEASDTERATVVANREAAQLLRGVLKQVAASADSGTLANLIEIIESAAEIIESAAEELETELGIEDDMTPDEDEGGAEAAALSLTVTKGMSDTIRWNPKLSKAFDVEKETFVPGTQELALVSKYIGCPVKRMQQNGFFVPSARMGSFLSALDESLDSDCSIEDVRNLSSDNKEFPPIFDTIQLNSVLSSEFLIDGIRFLDHKGSGKSVMHVSPSWYGLHVTTYVQSAQKSLMSELVQKTWRRAKELNFLKGEAFALSGEFIERDPDMDFSNLFLLQKQEDCLKQLVTRINEKGARMDNRGLIAIGPPGTGKTLSGRVLLNQAKATFIWLSARDFYYSGAFGGLAYAFEVARECSPSIIFIEDVDNWLSDRTTDLMKTEMDGIVRTKGITTVITTNYPERFPEALIDRPGRFHDVLKYDLPDESIRRRMLVAWLPKEDRTGIKEAVIDKAIEKAVKATEGYSGAHVRELASYVAVLKEQEGVNLPEAIEKAIAKIAENRETINAARGQAYSLREGFSEVIVKTAIEVQRSTAPKEEEKTKLRPTVLLKSISADPKEALSAFDRMRQIERKNSSTRFAEVDGRASADVSEVKDDDANIWCVVLRDHEQGSDVVYNLGPDVERAEVVDFAVAIVEERKDPHLEVCPARSIGTTEEGHTAYEEFLRLHWRDTVKGDSNINKNPALVPDGGSVAGTMDIIEAIKTHLGPTLKKALAEVTGRVVEDEE
jgi:hypothetical protein